MSYATRPDLSGHAYRKFRAQIAKRDGGICWLCGHPGADTLDHILEVARGGDPLDPDNAAMAHGKRNRETGCPGNYGRSAQPGPHQRPDPVPSTRDW